MNQQRLDGAESACALIEQTGQCPAAARVARDTQAARSSEVGSPTAAVPRRCGSLRGLGHAAADRSTREQGPPAEPGEGSNCKRVGWSRPLPQASTFADGPPELRSSPRRSGGVVALVVTRPGFEKQLSGFHLRTLWFVAAAGMHKQPSCCVALKVEELKGQCSSTGHRMSPSRAGIAGARSVMNCGPSRALLRFVPYVRVSRSLTWAALPTRSTPDGVGSLP